jgi:hypothetical protein
VRSPMYPVCNRWTEVMEKCYGVRLLRRRAAPPASRRGMRDVFAADRGC